MKYNKYHMALTAAAVLVAGGLTACISSPPPDEEQVEDQGPVKPADAFNKVDEPHRDMTGIGRESDNLSTDIERLQDARRQYEHDKAQEQAERLRRQAECREKPDSDKVPIQDGSDQPSVYCQEKPDQQQPGAQSPPDRQDEQPQ